MVSDVVVHVSMEAAMCTLKDHFRMIILCIENPIPHVGMKCCVCRATFSACIDKFSSC